MRIDAKKRRRKVPVIPRLENLESRQLLSGTWTPLAQSAPGGVGTMMLMPDGAVIAPINAASTTWAKLTPDSAGSYINGTWSLLANAHDSRLYNATQVLPDGRLF